MSGDAASSILQQDRLITVRVIFPEPEREDEERIGNILVPAADGGHVPLREVARIDKAMGKAAINRESNSRVLALKFNIEGRDMGSVVADAMAAVKRDVQVPEGNFLQWGGEFENQKRAMARLEVIVPFSFLVVFAPWTNGGARAKNCSRRSRMAQPAASAQC